MGSWARAGGGCTLHSGGCTAWGLGPAGVEVLSRGRKAVGVGKGGNGTAKWHSTMSLIWGEVLGALEHKGQS